MLILQNSLQLASTGCQDSPIKSTCQKLCSVPTNKSQKITWNFTISFDCKRTIATEHNLQKQHIKHIKQGWIQRFLKGGVLYVSQHGWPAKKILGFRCSEKAEVTLETISFWQNISISIFKIFSIFIEFFKIY